MTVFAVALVVVMAVFFGGMGVYGIVAPTSLVAPFGIAAGSGDARNEVRAVYGGFGLAMACLLVSTMSDLGSNRGMLITIGTALLGMAAGRLVACLWERPGHLYPVWFYFGIEVAGGGVLLLVASIV